MLPQYQRIKNLAVDKSARLKPPKPVKEKKKIYASYSWYKDGCAPRLMSGGPPNMSKPKLTNFSNRSAVPSIETAVKILNDTKSSKTDAGEKL